MVGFFSADSKDGNEELFVDELEGRFSTMIKKDGRRIN